MEHFGFGASTTLGDWGLIGLVRGAFQQGSLGYEPRHLVPEFVKCDARLKSQRALLAERTGDLLWRHDRQA